MAESITCPNCGKKVLLSKALTAQIEESLRKNFELEARKREREIENEYKQKMAAEKKLIEKKAQDALAIELAELRQQVSEKNQEIETARKQELELRKRQRDLEKKEREMELEIARRMDDERRRIEEEIRKRLIEDSRIKDLEKEKQLSDLRRQIEELKLKAELGSQQVQGEVAEIELEELLRGNFPYDHIEPVPKGIRGADVIQRVHNQMGQYCGTIIWESKNARNWSDSWIVKLKDDQRALKADIAVLASVSLPKGRSHFAYENGVWITDFSTIIGVASALRINLIQVASTKLSSEGKSGKMEMLYSYLSGTEFKQRVESIVESFIGMKEDLDREKRLMETTWSKREKQMHRIIQGIAGMYGDMQGIIGSTLPKIEYLELPSPNDDA